MLKLMSVDLCNNPNMSQIIMLMFKVQITLTFRCFVDKTIINIYNITVKLVLHIAAFIPNNRSHRCYLNDINRFDFETTIGNIIFVRCRMTSSW
jgi:hypothetical protein